AGLANSGTGTADGGVVNGGTGVADGVVVNKEDGGDIQKSEEMGVQGEIVKVDVEDQVVAGKFVAVVNLVNQDEKRMDQEGGAQVKLKDNNQGEVLNKTDGTQEHEAVAMDQSMFEASDPNIAEINAQHERTLTLSPSMEKLFLEAAGQIEAEETTNDNNGTSTVIVINNNDGTDTTNAAVVEPPILQSVAQVASQSSEPTMGEITGGQLAVAAGPIKVLSKHRHKKLQARIRHAQEEQDSLAAETVSTEVPVPGSAHLESSVEVSIGGRSGSV
ncbi:hypothetical protein HDU76_011763, partial [Blyttiomyces sp. JEL0837]